jgi:FixJ family two-component response regulator
MAPTVFIIDDDARMRAAIQQVLECDAAVRQQQNEIAELKERYERLTEREREVMTLVVSGMLTNQIASTLGISEITTTVHRGHVMRKTQADTPAELAEWQKNSSFRPRNDRV